MAMLDISVVIVSFNTAALLETCLRSIYGSRDQEASPEQAQVPAPAEVIVVDNGSTDGSPEMVESCFPQVRLIACGTNLGFAAANNRAIEVAAGRYILLLNPDTEVLGDAIAKLAAFLDANPLAAVAGAQLQNPDGTHQHSAFGFPGLLMTFFDFFPVNHRLISSRLNGRYPVSRSGRPFQIDHPLGACMMVRREAIVEVGLLDEQFFMYCEEIDWCMRMKARRWRMYCVPEARVVHHGGQSTQQLKGAMYAELFKSRALLFRKHRSIPVRLAARSIIGLGLWSERRKAEERFRAGLIDGEELKQELETLDRAGMVVSKYA